MAVLTYHYEILPQYLPLFSFNLLKVTEMVDSKTDQNKY